VVAPAAQLLTSVAGDGSRWVAAWDALSGGGRRSSSTTLTVAQEFKVISRLAPTWHRMYRVPSLCIWLPPPLYCVLAKVRVLVGLRRHAAIEIGFKMINRVMATT
jgi:hypothetical protein